MKLIESESALLALMQRIADAQESGEEIPPDAIAELQSATIEAADKRDSVRAAIQHMDLRDEQLTQDIADLTARRDAIRNARERFKSYVLSIMRTHGVVQANGTHYKFVVARGREAVEVDDLPLIMGPQNFHALQDLRDACPNIRISVDAAKDVIARKLKAGEMVYGASMKRGEPSLQVKPLSSRDEPGVTITHEDVNG